VENNTEIFTAKIIIMHLVSDRGCGFYSVSVGLYNRNTRLQPEYTIYGINCE